MIKNPGNKEKAGVVNYKDYWFSNEHVIEYDDKYKTKGLSSYLWNLEKQIISNVIREMKKEKNKIDYLDFACGSGRVISFVESQVDSSAGIDTSPLMVERACEKTSKSHFLCKDIIKSKDEVEKQYDLITAFRFFLNMNEDKRKDYLAGLVKRLKDKDSVLIRASCTSPQKY